MSAFHVLEPATFKDSLPFNSNKGPNRLAHCKGDNIYRRGLKSELIQTAIKVPTPSLLDHPIWLTKHATTANPTTVNNTIQKCALMSSLRGIESVGVRQNAA